jgi:putative membrane protein
MPHLRWMGALFLLVAGTAQAHVPEAGGESSSAWLTVLLLLCAVLYAAGTMRLWPHARMKRPLIGRALAFSGGWVALAAALLSPLDRAAAGSFAFHMVQHEMLMLVAAPLLVVGRGLPTFLWSLPHDARVALARRLRAPALRLSWCWLTAPLSAWLLHAAALWVWHVPALFNAAVTSDVVHEWQHATFLVTALIFWHALLRRGSQGARGMSLIYLFTTTIHTGVLGALLTFAPRPLYATLDPGLLEATTLTPLEDQQLGGLIMWVPGALVYVSVGLWLAARWLRALGISPDVRRAA